MIYAYEDEDNAPMVMDLLLPYQIRTWEEMIKEWEGEHNADGQSEVSGGLEEDRAGGEKRRRMEMRGMRNEMQGTGREIRHAQADADSAPHRSSAGELRKRESDRVVRRMPPEGGRCAPRGNQEEA